VVHPADRLGRVPPYLFAALKAKVSELRAKGVELIDLGIGDPDLPTPEHIVRAAQGFLTNAEYHRYPPDLGFDGFRRAGAEYYGKRFGVQLDWQSEVLALIGSKEGLAHLIWAFVDPGDAVLLPDPAYPVYNTQTLLAGGEVRVMPLTEENAFLPDLKSIPADAARRAKVMFINYPNNPTGAVATLEYLQQAVDYCRRHDILLVNDLAYAEMTYDGFVAPSVLQAEGARECSVEFYSLSKPYNMTGWRIAFCAGNRVAVAALAKLKSSLDSSQFGAVQAAGEIALTRTPREFLDAMNATYASRREIMCAGLTRAGLPCKPPLGTFYLWVRVPAGETSVGFAERLLTGAGVVVSPGSAFGGHGEGYVRIALTVPEDQLHEAVRRIGAAV